MNRYKLLVLMLAAFLLAAVFAPNAASAANSDFEVTFSFSPETTGFLGGDVALTLTVSNVGHSDIKWVE